MEFFRKKKEELGTKGEFGVIEKTQPIPLNIKFKKISPNFEIPKKGKSGDACYDVKITSIKEEGGIVICGLGFATEIPIGYKGVIVPRSSFTKYGWVQQNSPSQMDCHYRGEWLLKFRPLPLQKTFDGIPVNEFYSQKFPYKVGESAAQIYFEKEIEVEFEIVDKLSETERGDGGFGHTGK